MSNTDPAKTIPDGFWEGIDQFNRGDFYACHDTLEAIWMESEPTDKPFYQGILQIAVGFYHLGNHNWRGAAILLGEGSRRLEPYEPTYHRLQITAFLDDTADWLETIQTLGPDQVDAIATYLTDSPSPEIAPLLEQTLSRPQIKQA